MIRVERAFADEIHRSADAVAQHVGSLRCDDLDLGDLTRGNHIQVYAAVAAVVGEHGLAIGGDGVKLGGDAAYIDISPLAGIALE